MQLFVVIPVLIFKPIFWVNLDSILIFLRLHTDNVVSLLLLLVNLFIRDISVQRLERIGAHMR